MFQIEHVFGNKTRSNFLMSRNVSLYPVILYPVILCNYENPVQP